MAKLRNELVWSTSRGRTFADCRRRYYYNYYGSWGGWERGADERTREIYALKQLSARFLWAGGVVHDEIARILRKIRDGGEPPEPEQVVDDVVWKMRREFKESRDVEGDAFRSDPKRTFRLMEHEYDLQIRPERWVETRDSVMRCLRNFFRSEAYETLRGLERESWLYVEDPASGPERTKIGDLEVYAIPDCAFRDEAGTVHVIDWKTGRKKGANWDQLALYALFAEDRWNVPATSVKAREVNLYHGTETEHQLEDHLLDRLREKIRASLDEMHSMLVDGDAERNEPLEEEAFDLAEDTSICRWCFFQGVCPAVES